MHQYWINCFQVVATIPRINVSRYNAEESNRGASKRTVKVKSRYGGGETKLVRKRNASESEGVGKTDEGEFMVRGRKFQTHKPITFNQPWTKEEQKRLEELLEIFPFTYMKYLHDVHLSCVRPIFM